MNKKTHFQRGCNIKLLILGKWVKDVQTIQTKRGEVKYYGSSTTMRTPKKRDENSSPTLHLILPVSLFISSVLSLLNRWLV